MLYKLNFSNLYCNTCGIRCNDFKYYCNKCAGSVYCSKGCQSMDYNELSKNIVQHKWVCKYGSKICANIDCKNTYGELYKCTGCNITKYCSKECQTTCWESHKKICIRINNLYNFTFDE